MVGGAAFHYYKLLHPALRPFDLGLFRLFRGDFAWLARPLGGARLFFLMIG